MKKVNICLILVFAISSGIHAQNSDVLALQDSLSNHSQQKWLRAARTPAILMSAGLIAFTDNELLGNQEIREERNEHMPAFRTHVDDYIQYAPIVAVYGLNALGVKGKNDFVNRSLLLVKSELIMAALVVPIKSFSHELRPDESNHSSFPSGHTAQAFVAATFLHKEYGHISPWYSIGAYTIASSVGIFRILNNKHYASDVLFGAGIGILSTNIAYMTHKYRWGQHPNKPAQLTVMPFYYQGALGFNLNLALK
jgi:hypothetical protein